MESIRQTRQRAGQIVRCLKREFPNAKSGLSFNTPFELLIKTILSAQCTDLRVNQVGETLFRKYHSPADFVSVPVTELEKDIRSLGFFRSKARHIQGCCQKLMDQFNGKVPSTMEDLTQLAGVGRKTANVILGNVYQKPSIVVDTHVARLGRRLQLTRSSSPEKIERDLKKVIDPSDWTITSHLLILHGRTTCAARKPRCSACGVSKFCPSFKVYVTEGV
ncbi:MAG: endonuclease III [Bacteroidetes bacterium]|nr:endonuclease III [Bacteroidota bacterium]